MTRRRLGQDDVPVDPAEARAAATQVVYDRLAQRSHSRHDLEQAIAKKGVPADIAADVLDRFKGAGLVDDAEFARSWVQGRQRGKGLSSRALAHELRTKGVDDEIARDALAELDPELEVQAAHRLVQRKLRSTAGLDTAVRTRRLVAMLARKGYSPNIALTVVRDELGAEPEPLESL